MSSGRVLNAIEALGADFDVQAMDAGPITCNAPGCGRTPWCGAPDLASCRHRDDIESGEVWPPESELSPFDAVGTAVYAVHPPPADTPAIQINGHWIPLRAFRRS